METYKDLLVYQRSMDFVALVYVLTKKFPSEEKFGLTIQLRRAAVSIPSNIAEGSQRKTKKEFVQFLYIAYGSLAEVETQLQLAFRFDYLSKKDMETIKEKYIEISKMLRSFIRTLEVSRTS